MIFVTVGTHEQAFDRLLIKIDELIEKGIIKEEVIIQKGYSTYSPKKAKSFKMISGTQMEKYMREARIVITHGGPSSFISALRIGKFPIVVPRQKQFKEHVNDHQLIFCKQLVDRGYPIFVIEDINDLEKVIVNFDSIVSSKTVFVSNNEKFNNQLIEHVKKLFE